MLWDGKYIEGLKNMPKYWIVHIVEVSADQQFIMLFALALEHKTIVPQPIPRHIFTMTHQYVHKSVCVCLIPFAFVHLKQVCVNQYSLQKHTLAHNIHTFGSHSGNTMSYTHTRFKYTRPLLPPLTNANASSSENVGAQRRTKPCEQIFGFGGYVW